MSQFSKELLHTSHKDVHEQLDFLIVAMKTHTKINTAIFYAEIKGKSSKEIEKWIKNETSDRMKRMGHSFGFFGFLKRKLLLSIFQLYECFYEQYISNVPFKKEVPLQEIQYSVLMLAAEFLDNQFLERGIADISAFLKQDLDQTLCTQINENKRSNLLTNSQSRS